MLKVHRIFQNLEKKTILTCRFWNIRCPESDRVSNVHVSISFKRNTSLKQRTTILKQRNTISKYRSIILIEITGYNADLTKTNIQIKLQYVCWAYAVYMTTYASERNKKNMPKPCTGSPVTEVFPMFCFFVRAGKKIRSRGSANCIKDRGTSFNA